VKENNWIILKQRVIKLYAFLGREVVLGVLLAIFFSLLVFVVETSFVFVLQGFLTTLGVMEKSKTHLPSWYPTSVNASVGILIVFGLSRSLVNIASYYVSVRIPTLFDTIQKKRIMEYSFLHPEGITMSKAMATFSELCIRGNKGVGYLISTTTTLITITFYFFVGLSLAPYEMIIGILIVLTLSLPLRFLNKSANRAGLETFKEWNSITEMLVDGVRNNFFFKMYGLIESKRDECIKSIDAYLKQYNLSYLIISIKNNIPNFLGVLTLAILMFISLNYIKTPGEILLSFFYIFIRIALGFGKVQSELTGLRIQYPALKELYTWYLKWKSSSEELMNKVAGDAAINDRAIKEIQISGVLIEASGVNFNYPGFGEVVLRDISFQLKKGEALVISGESGTGKSTLLSLILGVLSPSAGTVKINGQDASLFNKTLSRYIGYVGPNPYIITDTIRNNLLYGHYSPGKVTDDEIWEALENAEVADFVRASQKGLNTFFNEEAPISTGQKQRLSIARVYLRKPELVVLDEITANLDSETERKIVENLKPLLKLCTSLIVTHRDAMLELATQKIHLKKAKNS